MNNDGSTALQYAAEGAGKSCAGPSETIVILDTINLAIRKGESVAIVGASGSGKSTLLHLLGALDYPTKGRILFEGKDLATMNAEEQATFRNHQLGFVFQFHHLLPEFSTVENVAMQAMIAGMPQKDALGLAEAALEKVGLAERRNHRVTTLSGGERQRAAIARAVLLRPSVLLADEPTGNLDEKTGQKVMDLLMELNDSLTMTLIMVTHNREIASSLGRCLELRSGELYAETHFSCSDSVSSCSDF